MFNIAIKSLLSHKLRLALTAMAIVLGVSMVSGTYVFTDSINKTFTGLFDDVFGGIDITVSAKQEDFGAGFGGPDTGGGGLLLDESVLDDVLAIDGVLGAQPSVEGRALVVKPDGTVLGAGQGPPGLGFSWVDESEFSPLSIKEGNGREPLAPGEFVVDVNTAETNDFKIGDKFRIQTEVPAEEFELVGLVSFGEADSLAGAILTAFEFTEAQRLFDAEGKLTSVNAVAVEGVSPEQLQERAIAALGDDFEVQTGDQQAQETQADINSALGFLNTGLLAFAGVAIFVGTFIIQNTFRIIISQRSKELALLRAVGATKRQVLVMVLLEALVIGIVASIIGFFLGIVIAEAIRGLGNAVGLGLPEGELTLLPRTVILSLVVGVSVTLASATAPALKASKVTPVEALRDNEASSQNRSLRSRGIWSLVLAILGGGSMAFGLFGSIATPIIYVGLGVFLLFLAMAVFAPILSGPLGSIIGWPFTKTRGVPGLLAQQNTRRTPRRTASTASALMIGVSLVAFVSIFASSVKATVDETVTESLGSDLIVYAADFISGVDTSLADDLENVAEVGVVSRTYYANSRVEGESEELITAIEQDSFEDVIGLEPTSSFSNLTDDSIFVRKTLLDEKGWAIGDTISVELAVDQPVDLEIIGTYEKDFDTKLIGTYGLINKYIEDRLVDSVVYANYADFVSLEEGREAVDAALEDYPAATVQSLSELVEQTKTQIDQILGLFWGLLGLAIMIAVLGITNTLALSISERTRELGLLRAVGMLKRQVRSMVRIESVIISLFGASLGMIMGIFFAWAVLKALESDGLTEFLVPPGQITTYFVLAAVAGVIASIWPAFRAARVNILDALNFE